MTSLTPAAVAISYFDALRRGDFPTAMSLLSDDVVWHQPGNHGLSGTHTGAAGVGSLLGRMMDISGGTFQLSVEGAPMENGSLVAVPVRFTGRRGDVNLDMQGVDLLTITDGQIREVHLFSEDQALEDSFWGQA